MVVDHICVNYGAELYQELFNKLHDRDIEQNVFYPRNRKHRTANPDRPYRIDSPRILSINTKISLARKLRVMRQSYDPLFHRNKPDLIHAHTLFSDGSLANYYHKKCGTPFVVAIRSTDMDVFLKYKSWLSGLGKQIAENARNIIFISPSLERKFREQFGSSFASKSLLIPNGINQAYFNTEPPGEKKLQAPLKLLYVGSFQKLKKVPALIRLVESTEAGLTIVGEGGSDEKKVLRSIRSSDKINYRGRIDDPYSLSKIYRQSDIFVMSSQRETFGLVYAEAMSQGLPLIYSRNTGIDGFFEAGKVGYGVSPGSVAEMKGGIEKILANYQEISGNCLSEARQFNWLNIADKYHEIYKSASTLNR